MDATGDESWKMNVSFSSGRKSSVTGIGTSNGSGEPTPPTVTVVEVNPPRSAGSPETSVTVTGVGPATPSVSSRRTASPAPSLTTCWTCAKRTVPPPSGAEVPVSSTR